jgi:hypothetical protein
MVPHQLAWVVIAAAKHPLVHALFGFIPGLAVYAGVRLAKPRSVWAERLYGERRPDKQARAEHRSRSVIRATFAW